MSSKMCERVEISTPYSSIDEIQGRTATLCEDDGMAVLKMFKNGRLVNTAKFPLYSWEVAREFGAGYLVTGGRPAKARTAT